MNEIDTQISVAANHPSLAGHFPERPVVPGVVLLEAIVEAIGRALGGPVELITIVSTKFLRAVDPDTSLDVHIKLDAEPTGLVKARFTGSHDAAPVLEGSLLIRSDVVEQIR